MTFTPAKQIAGMTPWTCSFIGMDGLTYGITLYATDPGQLLEDNCELLPGLRVDGKLEGTVDAD